NNVETAVIAEDLDATVLEDRGLGYLGVSDEQIQTIAEENAEVSANVEHEQSDPDPAEHLTAPQDGDWLVIL
ncbi:MAG: hypothetical protein J07HX5_02078, partial [halophilic archaeon J07HX5]